MTAMDSLTRDSFGYISDLVRRESGIQLETGKEYLVESRISPVAHEHGFHDVSQLVRHLRHQASPRIVAQLVAALTTNETSWFRDPELYRSLGSHLLPTLVRRRSVRRLRLWSAACSSGQEPYSVLIAAAESVDCIGVGIEMLGTDINPAMVDRARTGRYGRVEVMRGLTEERRRRHFVEDGDAWVVDAGLRAQTTFKQLNLTRPFPVVGQYDLVLLRNVLIYFDVETKRDVLARMRRIVAPDGFLVLGTAETVVGVDDAWVQEPGHPGVYRLA